MNDRCFILSEIRLSLSEWNPIGVPDYLAGDEYAAYAEMILDTGCDVVGLKLKLIDVLVKTMGLDFDESDPDQVRDLDSFVLKIHRILVENGVAESFHG